MTSPAPRIALRIERDTPCPGCGYNLRGLRLDGRCPECGRAAIDTFARPLAGIDGHLCGEMLGIAGRLLIVACLGALAVLAVPARARVGGLPLSYFAALPIAVPAGLLGLRAWRMARLAGRYRLAEAVRAARGTWPALATVTAVAPAMAILTDDPAGIGRAAAFGGVALLGFLAATAATTTLRRNAVRATVGYGPIVLPACAVAAGVVGVVPMPWFGTVDGLAARAGGCVVVLLISWRVWLVYGEALRRGSGPVSGM